MWLCGWFFASINVCGRMHRTELTPFSVLIYYQVCSVWIPIHHFRSQHKRTHVPRGEATNTWILPQKAEWKVENRSKGEWIEKWEKTFIGRHGECRVKEWKRWIQFVEWTLKERSCANRFAFGMSEWIMIQFGKWKLFDNVSKESSSWIVAFFVRNKYLFV